MIAWLEGTLAASTLLFGLVLLMRRAVARTFGARVAYALWLIPALRMMTPALPASWYGAEPPPTAVADAIGTNALASLTASPAFAWQPIILIVWLTGVMLFLFKQWLSYRRFSDTLDQKSLAVHGLGRIKIARCEGLSSPLALGFVQPRVMLPIDFAARFDAAEQRMALAHEVAHHRRGDLFASLTAIIILALHWFNPLAHLAWRAFRDDQEAACDASILANASDDERKSYGLALIKAATSPVPMAACGMGAASVIRARLALLSRGVPARNVSRISLLLVFLAAPVAAATTASRALPEPTIAFGNSAIASLGGEMPVLPIRTQAQQRASKPNHLVMATRPAAASAPVGSYIERRVDTKKSMATLAAPQRDIALAEPAAANDCQHVIIRRSFVAVAADGSLFRRDVTVERCAEHGAFGARIVRLQGRRNRSLTISQGLSADTLPNNGDVL